MKKLGQFKNEGYSVCVPQKAEIDTGIIGKLKSQLMCKVDETVIHVSYAFDYLTRGKAIVDEDGDLITFLEYNLEKKLVVVDGDLNLWYALLLQNSEDLDDEVEIEILNSTSKYFPF